MNRFHVECLPDETFLHSFGIPRKQITHHPGRDRVGNYLKRNSGHIGMVDEDPGSTRHPYFSTLKPETSVGSLTLVVSRNQTDGNVVITLKPRLEGFLFRLVAQCKLNPVDFGLPEREERWHDILTLKKNQDKLFRLLEIMHSKNIPEFEEIRKVIS